MRTKTVCAALAGLKHEQDRIARLANRALRRQQQEGAWVWPLDHDGPLYRFLDSLPKPIVPVDQDAVFNYPKVCRTRPVPYLCFRGVDADMPTGRRATSFKIVLGDPSSTACAVFPIGVELLSDIFWDHLWGDGSAAPAIPDDCDELREYHLTDKLPDLWPSMYDSRWECDYAIASLWDYLNEFEGESSISRERFRQTILTLRCLVSDTIDHPLGPSSDWPKRRRIIESILDGEGETNKAVFGPAWRDFLADAEETPEQALLERALDARDFMNDSTADLHGDSSQVRLLRQMLGTFGEALIRARLLIRCEWCNQYARYHNSKKYCSPVADGLDCGKLARNHRDYYKHRDVRRKNARQSKKEDRKLYKEHGIKK